MTSNATNRSAVVGEIGDNVTIDVQSGDFDFLIDLDGQARGTSTSTSGAIGDVGFSSATVVFNSSADLTVGTAGSISAADDINIGAYINYDHATESFIDQDGGSADGRGAIGSHGIEYRVEVFQGRPLRIDDLALVIEDDPRRNAVEIPLLHVVLGGLHRRAANRERGDVPGWVLITLMTAGLVTILWALAGTQLAALFTEAISSVTGP